MGADVPMMPEAPRRIGIVMLSALGDAVHVLPVVTALRRHWPESHIGWIVQPPAAALVAGHHAVDELIVFDRSAGWRAFPTLRRELVQRPFDLVLSLQTYLKAGVITELTKARVKLGFDLRRARDLNWLFTTRRIAPSEPRHVQDQYLEFLHALGVPHEPVDWRLGPWDAERKWQRSFVERFDRPLVSLVVGSSKTEKDWIAERWAELADALWSDYGLHPVVVGGSSARERATAAAIQRRLGARVTTALGGSIRQAVSILDASALVVSLDTGPLHMSVALDRPVIALMGYSNPKRVGPYRRFHDLLVDAYGDPGEDYPISMQNRRGRMPRIRVEDVLAKADVWRERYAGSATR